MSFSALGRFGPIQYRMEFGIKMKNGINGRMGCGRVTVW